MSDNNVMFNIEQYNNLVTVSKKIKTFIKRRFIKIKGKE